MVVLKTALFWVITQRVVVISYPTFRHNLSVPPATLVPIYRVSQDECARLREGVPYVKVYRYNPKHLYPKLNGYGDNGQRKVRASCGSKYCNMQADTSCNRLTSLRVECSVHCACVTLCAVSHVTSPRGFLMYSACKPKHNYDTSASVFVVQFNGFMSLTS